MVVDPETDIMDEFLDPDTHTETVDFIPELSGILDTMIPTFLNSDQGQIFLCKLDGSAIYFCPALTELAPD